ncbi:retroviral-like aspartic protease family protein [Candidatus Poriferisodalis sp.]|uniref:retroviral-like aspartic protease family protein n=1 Tax=Candidatus Poriferisodalis sp. TaxID=3101277 RepID=UPI003AF72DA6
MVVLVAASETADDRHAFKALVDTGATGTAVSQAVIDALRVASCGVRQTSTADGSVVDADEYMLCVHIPVRTTSMSADGNAVVEDYRSTATVKAIQLGFDTSACDVIVGMDMLSRYHITMFNNQFVMSI